MSKVRVANFAISIDGYSSAPGQTREEPFGPGGLRVMEWFFPTDTFRKMQKKSGETGIDNDFSARSMTGMGAWILGRNMFGPIRGPWPDDSWKGWWGEDPPYHVPTFVLTHHPRAPIDDEGGHGLPLRHRGDRRGARPAPETPLARRISGSAVASRPSANTSRPDWWTRCTWPSHRFSLAQATRSSPGPTSMGWGTSAWSESPESGRHT